MSTTHFRIPADLRPIGRRIGYVIAVLVNLALLFVVINILEWDVLPWLTDDFSEVVTWIGFSLAASIALNLGYLFKETQPFKSLGRIVVDLISIAVTFRIFRVFPFDFSQYSFNWEIVTRLVLALAMAGAGIGVMTEIVKLASWRPYEKEGGHVTSV